MVQDEDVRRGIVVLCFGVLGVILAAIEQLLIDNGWLLDEYIAESVTAADLQIVTILLAFLVGVLVAVVWSK